MMNNTASDRKLLELFVSDNAELEQLESLLSQFNIFEAIGAVRQELRHSDFLAFLLDPKQNHGLRDAFLKRLLMNALQDFENASLSLVDIEVSNLNEAVVVREWQKIDILLVDEKSRLVVAIENKVDTGEHDNQLSRYRLTVQHAYTEYSHVFIFLTPDELLPENEEDRLHYISLSYESIADVIDFILKTRHSSLNDDVLVLLEHYRTMLRRHIVSDSEIAELCRKIYQKHRQALDLIFEHIPNLQQEIINYCIDYVKSNPEFIHESKIKRAVSFGLVRWDNLSPLLLHGQKWGGSTRLLRFWIFIDKKGLVLNLYLWPSDLQQVRKTIFDIAQRHAPLFSTYNKAKIFDNWQYIYQYKLLSNPEIEKAESLDDIKSQLDAAWGDFLSKQLPAVCQVIESQIPWTELEALQ